MGEKLTNAQRAALVAARKSGGVIGFGQKWRTVFILRERGLLTKNRDNYGYYNITDEGRAALREAGDE